MSGMKQRHEDRALEGDRAEARRALAEAAKGFGLDDESLDDRLDCLAAGLEPEPCPGMTPLDDDRLDVLAAELDEIDLGDARLVSDPELMRRIGLAEGDGWSLDDRVTLTGREPADDDFDDDEPEGRP